MIYEDLEAISRTEFATELASADLARVGRALLRAALHDTDREWLENVLAESLTHHDPRIRSTAATCVGHVARIHRAIDAGRVLPLVKALLASPQTAGAAQDALDDIDVFVRPGGRHPADGGSR